MGQPDSRRKVLIIEDNDDLADSMAMLLRMQGYRVDVARSGDEGLAAAIAARPDAILLDIGMPKMHGYAVASRLRARGDFDVSPGASKPATDGRLKTSQGSWGFSSRIRL
jgi:CheY-like chemotaxis protein